MTAISVTGVSVLDNPCSFTEPFKFQITFECLSEIQEPLEWKLTYVGSAENDKYDQLLDSVLVGPVQVGTNAFVFTAPPPDPALVPRDDLLEVTVVLLTCSYREKEFIRIGYYVNITYDGELETQVKTVIATDDDQAEFFDDVMQDEEGGEGEAEDGVEGAEGGDDEAGSEGNAAAAASDADASMATGESKEPPAGDAGEGQGETAAVTGEGTGEAGKAGEGAGVRTRTYEVKVLPANVDFSLLRRELIADEPRVTRFPHDWDTDRSALQAQQEAALLDGNSNSVHNTHSLIGDDSNQSMEMN